MEAFLFLTQQNLKFRSTNILLKDIKIVIKFFSYFIRIIVRYRHITYIKIRIPFHAIFKYSRQKPLPHILKLLTFEYQAGQSIHSTHLTIINEIKYNKHFFFKLGINFNCDFVKPTYKKKNCIDVP